MFDLKTSDPATWRTVDGWRRYYERAGDSAARAVTRAVTKLNGPHFRTLQARFPQCVRDVPTRHPGQSGRRGSFIHPPVR